MKGNIMDKKILLGGAAALLLVGNMYATPANAAIDLTIGGEAKLTAAMGDKCFTAATAESIEDIVEDAILGAAGNGDTDALLNAYIAGLKTSYHNSAVFSDAGTPDATHADSTLKWDQDPCAGAAEDNPVWGFGKEITFDASGTLANGLSVSFSDKIDLTDVDKEEGSFELVLEGAFGMVMFKDGTSSGIDQVMINNFDIDVTGNTVGGEPRGRMPAETAGTAGTGITYGAPTMGDLELYVSYAPNSDDSGLNSAKYTDTLGFGAKFNADALTIAAGMESASANTAGKCAGIAAGAADDFTTVDEFVRAVYIGDFCGDQTLTYIGAEMAVADLSLNAGYTKKDTDGADMTVMGVGLDTTVGAYDFGIEYRTNELSYALKNLKDKQTVIGASVGTALGDGVDLNFQFSTNQVELASQAKELGSGGNGKQTITLLK